MKRKLLSLLVLLMTVVTGAWAQEPSNKFDLAFKAANANTIESGKATVTVKEGTGSATDRTGDITEGKLTGVKMGSEVKMTAAQGYKFRKVEVKKASKTLTITDGNLFSTTLDIAGCTTWDEVITKNSNMIMKNSGGHIFDLSGDYELRKGGLPVNVKNDPFDPNATNYKWV